MAKSLLDMVSVNDVSDEELAANMDSHDASVSPKEIKRRIIASRGQEGYNHPKRLPKWQKALIKKIRANWKKLGLE